MIRYGESRAERISDLCLATEVSQALGERATLDDIPDAEMDRLAALGFDWFLSVWQTGPAAQAASRSNAGSRKEFQETLPELHEEDIAGSGFAIQNYTVHRGLKLMLDFVPNPMAPHHPWVDEQPDYFVQGNESDLAHAPLPTSKRAS